MASADLLKFQYGTRHFRHGATALTASVSDSLRVVCDGCCPCLLYRPTMDP
jgi:hypothetical protein